MLLWRGRAGVSISVDFTADLDYVYLLYLCVVVLV